MSTPTEKLTFANAFAENNWTCYVFVGVLLCVLFIYSSTLWFKPDCFCHVLFEEAGSA